MASSKARRAVKARSGRLANTKRKQIPPKKTSISGTRKSKPRHSVEKGLDHFAEEMEWHGKRVEKYGKRLEKKMQSWWYNTFGPVAPLIQSLVNIAIVGIIAILIDMFNAILVSQFVTNLSIFIMDSIPIFLAIFLFFNYIKYFYHKAPNNRHLLRPLEVAAGVTVIFWLFAWVLLLAHQSAEIGFFQQVSNWIFPNLWNLFFIVLILAYLGILVVSSGKAPLQI